MAVEKLKLPALPTMNGASTVMVSDEVWKTLVKYVQSLGDIARAQQERLCALEETAHKNAQQIALLAKTLKEVYTDV